MGQNRRILVTGGAGFLGSRLCQQLLAEGHSVLCLDNFYTGNKHNIARLMDSPHFDLLVQDVCEPLEVQVDAIYHLACPASPPHYQRSPVQTLKTSVLGALNVLELAKRLAIPVLFSSTSEVYGDPQIHPQSEAYWGHVNPIGPRACYDEGKRCAETLFVEYQRTQGVDIRIARIFNTYGPYMDQDDGRVISNFIVQALTQKPLTLYGEGLQTRSFCYVDDTISGLIRLMEKPNLYSPINIGNPNEITIKEIANTIIQMTQSDSALHYHPLPPDDPKQRCPDISKAKKELDWEPKVDLVSGLKKTIHYFQEIITQKVRISS